MDRLLQDARFAFRSLRRNPAFTIAAILTLALGIGANTAIFSIVDGVLLRPAPVPNADRLMMVWETDVRGNTRREPSSLPDFLDFRQRSKTFASLVGFTSADLTFSNEGLEAQRIVALAVTDGFEATIGAVPMAGRRLETNETLAGGARSALVSEDFATRNFQSVQSALGKTMRLNGAEWTVVGVLPRTADFGMRQVLGASAYGRGFAERPDRARVDVWVGLRGDPQTLTRDTHPFVVMGRLAPGATREMAQAEMTAITTDIVKQFPVNHGRGALVEPVTSVIFGNVEPAMLTLLGAVALVLLVACANVANLLMVRASSRTREVTVRLALGAGTRRLAQQFLVESLMLTSAGAILGVMLAASGMDVIRALAPAGLPRIDSVSLDGRVLGLTAGITCLVAVIFGLLPTLHTRSQSVQPSLRNAGSRSASAGKEYRRFRAGLIASELAMASMLMVGAGLLIRSLWHLQSIDTGFNAVGVLKAEYNLPASRYPRSFANFPRWVEQQRFDDALLTRLSGLPGVQSAALASNHPLDAGFTSTIQVVGREAESAHWQEPAIRIVSASYFETMRLSVLTGRGFLANDNPDGPPVMVVNEAAAKLFFANTSPINQHVRIWGAARGIVGVVADEKFNGIGKDASPAVYMPIAQAPPNGAHSILLRVAGDPSAFAAAVRSAVRDLDPQVPLFGVEPVSETIGKSMAQQRFTMAVLGAFAFVALLLACVGVHGVLSYTVAQRTSEIGIRMALGADAHSVRALVLGDGVRILGVGLAVGLGGALILSRALGALLFGVSAHDPMTFAVVAVSLAAVAMVAAYLPARRASRVDPMSALRSD